jgi:hypothetical protein
MSDTAIQLSRSQMPSVPEALTPDDVMAQVYLIQNIMERAMKKDEHYGVIPGTGNKPTLLKAGAEKLNLTFRMAPDPQVEVIDLGKGHREYRVKVVMTSITSGKILGAGVGSAATMETKWRFRTGPGESTGKPVPKEYWDLRSSDPKKAQEIIGGKGFITKKDEGVWTIFRQGEKVEHDNPADYYNTCLKMGKKRALVDAVLTCTAASDIFTQDIEELVDNGVIHVPAPPAPSKTPVSTPATASQDAPGSTQTPTVTIGTVQIPLVPPPVGEEKKDEAQLRHEIQELAAILSESYPQQYPTVVSAIQFATAYPLKDGSGEGSFKDVLKLKKWQLEKAIGRLNARLNAIPPPTDDDVIPEDDIKY